MQQIREELAKVIEDNINPQFEGINEKFIRVDKQFEGVNQRLTRVEATMVTKSYLDDKLADLGGDLVTKLRKEDAKLNRLVEIMKRKKVLTIDDTNELDEFQVFPRLSN